MDLKAEFDAVVQQVQNLPKEGPYQPSNSAKLNYYSWYKQATEGKCNEAQPSFFNLVARAKWDAWNSLGDMTKEEAMRLYIKEYKETSAKYNK